MRNKIVILLVILAAVFSTAGLRAQDDRTRFMLDGREYVQDTTILEHRDTVLKSEVILGEAKNNWFLSAWVGPSVFFGDFWNVGPFGRTIAPTVMLEGGKWLTPVFGLGVFAGLGQSYGFTVPGHMTPYTIREPQPFINAKGEEYYRQRINWVSGGVDIFVNLSRLMAGYEGSYTTKRLTQFVFDFGLQAVHHFKFENGNPQLNEVGARFGLQLQQFFNARKRVSLDVKVYTDVLQTNFDGLYDFNGCNTWDASLTCAIGFTFFIGANSWRTPDEITYTTSYRTRETSVDIIAPPVELKARAESCTFFVSYADVEKKDENDAPTIWSIEDFRKNFQDYLAGMEGSAVTFVQVKSVAAPMDYYSSDVAQMELRNRNTRLANTRAEEVVGLLRKMNGMSSANMNVTLPNRLESGMSDCVEVTIQYLVK